MSQKEWVEPRGPHLPDAITRIPLGVWPFLAVTALAAYGRWIVVTSYRLDDPVDLLWAVPTTVQHVAAPLLGAVLFYRHPRAYRTLPAVAFAAILLAFATIVDALRDPILNAIGPTPMFGSLDEALPVLADAGYSAIEALLRFFALTYLAIGLTDARRFEEVRPDRRWVVLVIACLGTAAFSTAAVLTSAPEYRLGNAIGLASQVLISLAWAYVGWVAYRGWTAGEQPRRGWGLAAVAGLGYVMIGVAVTVLNVPLWIVGPTESQVPLVYELYQFIVVGFAALWIALLAAFWLGLPAEPDPVDVEANELPEPA